MSKVNTKLTALIAPLSLAAGLAIATSASAAEYLADSQGENVVNSYEECWEVSYGLPTCGEERYTISGDGLFDFDKATIRPDLAAKLDQIVAESPEMKSKGYTKVDIVDGAGEKAEIEARVRRLQNAKRGCHDLRADAVAGEGNEAHVYRSPLSLPAAGGTLHAPAAPASTTNIAAPRMRRSAGPGRGLPGAAQLRLPVQHIEARQHDQDCADAQCDFGACEIGTLAPCVSSYLALLEDMAFLSSSKTLGR